MEGQRDPEGRDIWEARVTQGYRFTFAIKATPISSTESVPMTLNGARANSSSYSTLTLFDPSPVISQLPYPLKTPPRMPITGYARRISADRDLRCRAPAGA
jgi:hypothetical protein